MTANSSYPPVWCFQIISFLKHFCRFSVKTNKFAKKLCELYFCWSHNFNIPFYLGWKSEKDLRIFYVALSFKLDLSVGLTLFSLAIFFFNIAFSSHTHTHTHTHFYRSVYLSFCLFRTVLFTNAYLKSLLCSTIKTFPFKAFCPIFSTFLLLSLHLIIPILILLISCSHLSAHT